MSGVDVGAARLVAGGLPTPDAVEVGLTALEAMSLSAAGDTITRLCDEVERLRVEAERLTAEVYARGELIRAMDDGLSLPTWRGLSAEQKAVLTAVLDGAR